MTHFGVIVIVPPGTEDIDAAIERLMKPYDENGEWGRDGSRWDWYQRGGRFTGLLDPTYEPEKDPRNIEVCDLCGGTGDRASWRHEDRTSQHPSGCNGCSGTGRSVKWPTQWVTVESDLAPVRTIDPAKLEWLPAVLTPDGGWHEAVDGGYGMF